MPSMPLQRLVVLLFASLLPFAAMAAGPVLTTSPGPAAFVAGDNTTSIPVAVDPGLAVSDPDSTTLVSATIAITGNFQIGEDVLQFTNDGVTMGNVAASYNAGIGVMTLTSAGASATLAEWEEALRSVTYTDTAVTPDTATRTVSFAVNDGTDNSAAATRTITVTAIDQTPIVTTTGGTTNYQGGTAAVTIDDSITVTDLDNTTQSSATVSIGTGFRSGDTLGYINTSSALFGNVTASYNAATGVMTLTSAGATASNAQWSNALSSVTFSSTSTSYGNRTIAFATNDGSKTSAVATDTVKLLGLPAVTDVSSITPDGNYKIGDTITLTVTFDEAVLVDTSSGTPTLLMETGGVDHNATYVSGSGGNTLTFTYAVQAGDTSADLDYASTAALALNGSTVQSGAGVDAVLTLPATGGVDSVAGQHAIVVDGIAPTVVSVDAPTNGTYVAGDQLDFTVHYNEAVTVDTGGGTPRIAITLDTGGTVYADYVSGSGTTALVFRYTVVAGQADPNGIALATAIDLDGGGVHDGVGNAGIDVLNGIAATSGVLVGRADQVITFGAQAAQAFVPGGTFALAPLATASSGLAVSYGTQTAAICTVSGSTVTMLAAGTCTIAADQAGDSGYEAAATVTQSIAIGEAVQAITAFASDPAAPTFAPNGTFGISASGGASGNPVVFASTTPAVCGISASGSGSGSGSNRVTMLSAGTCVLTADQAGDANYDAAPQQVLEVGIAQAKPVLAWVGVLQKVVGEAAFDLPDPDSDSSGAFTFASSDPAVATVAGRTVTIAGPGTATLVATQAATHDYTEGTISTTLTVTARPDPTRDPEVTGTLQAQVDASVRFVTTQQNNIQDRLRRLRDGGSPAVNGLVLNYMGRGGGMGLPLGPQAGAARVMPAGLWTAGTITIGRRDPVGDTGKLSFRSDGLTIGFDHGFGKHLMLGMAGGYGWSDTDAGDASTLDGRQRSLAAYGLWRGDRHGFVDGVVGVGSLDFDIARWSDLVATTARARRSGDQVFGALTFGYEHAAEHMTLTSYGRYDASRTTLDAYAESGLGIYDLRYGRQAVEDSGIALGIEGRHQFKTMSAGYRPYWLVEYRNALRNRGDVGINYVVQPVASDYVMGLRSSFDDALSVGAGLDMDLPHGWQLALQFRHEQTGSNRAESYGIQLTWGNPAALGNLQPWQQP